MLVFRETSLFTRQVVQKLTDSEYLELQAAGKRGGVRVIYYWYAPASLVYLLLLYSKTDRDDLSAEEKKALRNLIRAEFK